MLIVIFASCKYVHPSQEGIMLSDAWLCEKLSWFVSGLSQWTLTHMVVSVTASSGRMGGGGKGRGCRGRCRSYLDCGHQTSVATAVYVSAVCVSVAQCKLCFGAMSCALGNMILPAVLCWKGWGVGWPVY